MNATPETRLSLLARVRDPADQGAWREFVEIYEPLIVRMARVKGMQPADAEDLVQQVLWAVAKAMQRREHDSQRARFRTWLHRVAHNAILNALSREKPDRGSGDSTYQKRLSQCASQDGPDCQLLQLEYRREVFRWAARSVRKEFQQSTWDAFWLTAVEGFPIDTAAQRLAKNRGAIYAARSRVMRRIQEKVTQYDREDQE